MNRKNIRLFIIIPFIFLFSLIFSINISATEIEEYINFENVYDSLDDETKEYLEESNITNETALSPDYNEIFETFKNIFSDYFPDVFKNFIYTFILCIIASVFNSFDYASEANELVFSVAGALMLYPPIINVSEALKNACFNVSVFVKASIPVYAGILTFSGKAVTGSTYSALTLFSAEAADFIVTSFALPLIPLMLSFCLASLFTGKAFDKINDKIFKAIKWTLVLTVTIFSTVTSLQTAVTSSGDALAIKGTRLMVSTAVPIVGSALGDALTALQGSLAIIRSGAGAFGILAVVFIFAPVIVSIILNIISLWGLSIICELFEMNKLSTLINGCLQLYKLMIASLFTMLTVGIISAAILITVIR